MFMIFMFRLRVILAQRGYAMYMNSIFSISFHCSTFLFHFQSPSVYDLADDENDLQELLNLT